MWVGAKSDMALVTVKKQSNGIRYHATYISVVNAISPPTECGISLGERQIGMKITQCSCYASGTIFVFCVDPCSATPAQSEAAQCMGRR